MTQPKKRLNLDRFARPDPAVPATALDALIGAPAAEVAERARELGLPIKHISTPQIAPDLQQLRRLPHPDDLTRMAEEGDHAAATILEELRALGQSMREHGQLQPIIVYPESGDPRFPQMTHRIVMGQRRWSGAVLLGLPTLWAVEVGRPSSVQRILHQYDENEQRAGLSDMERAWALQALKDALEEEAGGTVAWNVVEQQMQLSSWRRLDLMRLMRFSVEGQGLIARYRWPEWTLRALHEAIFTGDIDPDRSYAILWELTKIKEVTAPVVAALVEQHRRAPAQATRPEDARADDTEAVSPMIENMVRLSGMPRQLGKYRRGIDKLAEQVGPDIAAGVREQALREIEHLMNSLERLLRRLQTPQQG